MEGISMTVTHVKLRWRVVAAVGGAGFIATTLCMSPHGINESSIIASGLFIAATVGMTAFVLGLVDASMTWWKRVLLAIPMCAFAALFWAMLAYAVQIAP
jgi:hypothetical protein